MLSSGTRIGSTKILSWLGEGSTGQSYHCEATEGDFKGEDFYVKLIPREISEMNGFEDHFMQECQMLEQLEGRGIWPVKAFGIMKWKHWIGYEWLEGEPVEEPEDAGNDEGEVRPSSIRSLNDLLEVDPCRVTPDLLLNFMVSLHCGLYRIHQSGIAHGNVKPNNLLVRCNEKGEGEAWVTETGLFRLSKFKPIGGDENRAREITFLNQDGRSSLEEGDRFRPANSSEASVPDESWDIHALGKVVIWILEKTQGNPSEWNQWKSWAEQAAQENLSLSFPSIAHSMQGLPGIGDLSEYGIKVDDLSDEPSEELEAIRERRERKWALTEKENSVRFRRNMTGLVGSLFLLFSLCSGIYLYFMPGPWTEYIDASGELELRYKLGFGVFSGQAYGMIPLRYSNDGSVGKDATGKWLREDGLFKLSFREFKKTNDDESGKKRWQYLSPGATKPEDYHVWHDYLRHDKSREALILVKREADDLGLLVPVLVSTREGGKKLKLYPEKLLEERKGKIVPTELSFLRAEEEGINWTLFLGFGFFLASSIYHRAHKKLELELEESVV